MREKQSVYEIFNDTQVGGFNIYEQISNSEAVKYRFERQYIDRHLNKLIIIL